MSSYGFNWEHARYFHRVALTKSMRQTALYFEVSPSTVSRGLKMFEKAHGQKLFRDSKKVLLTEHGLALWPHLDQLFSAWMKTKAALAQQRDQEFDVLLGLPEIGIKPKLLQHINAFARSQGIQILPTGEASIEAIAFGEPHIGIVLDRPTSQPSLADARLITGGRYDVLQCVYRSRFDNPPHVLIGSYSDVEWEEIARQGYWDLPHARHNAMCAVTPELSREHIATIAMGLVALPIQGKAEDPVLEPVPGCTPMPLYSLHLLMHPAYKESNPHRLIREHLMLLLSQTPAEFYDGIAATPAPRSLPPP